jgi:hypothetical protein
VTRLWPEGKLVEIWGAEEALASTPIGMPAGLPTGVAAGVLVGFAWQGTSHRVVDVCNRWRIHTRWWEPPSGGGTGGMIWREYVKVTTDTGLLCLLYCDLLDGGWFLARVYD